MPKLLLLFFMCLLSIPSVNAIEPYTEFNAAYAFTGIEEEDFKVPSIEARLGVYVQKQVGLEAYYALGISDDERTNLNISLKQLAGINLRLESPETKGMKVFVLLGYGMSQWDVDRSGTGEPGKVDFDDASYGGGLEWRLGESKHWFINLKAQRFLNKDDLSLNTGSLGVRYVF